MPPLVFDRNLHHVPLPVRTADLMWAGAGISSLFPGSLVCIPTSVYSLPMTLAEHVGGWDAGPGAIGEDMHMYLKCFFALSGNLKSRIVYAAASQCNVSSGASGTVGYRRDLGARYKQAVRHMWGSMDSGYAIRQALDMLVRHYRARRSTALALPTLTDVAVYARNALLTAAATVCSFNTAAPQGDRCVSKRPVSKAIITRPASSKRIQFYSTGVLFHRLFEAHFLPIPLAMILAACAIYEHLPGTRIPKELALAFHLCGYFRLVGWTLMVVYFYRYEKYHRLCSGLRKEEMREAGMLDKNNEHIGFSPKVFVMPAILGAVLEGGLFPIGGFVFGAIPACQAVFSHLFTDRITYHVSLKPQFNIQQWRGSSPQQPKAPKRLAHSRSPSDTLRKRAFSSLDYITDALRYRPVKRED